MKAVVKEIGAKQARELLGWENLSNELLEQKIRSGIVDPHHVIVDFFRLKVHLNNLSGNRPLRKSVALRYMNDMLLNKWYVTGDSIVVDKNGNVLNGQHRLLAIVLANQLLDLKNHNSIKFPRKWSYLLPTIDQVEGPLSIKSPVVYLEDEDWNPNLDMTIPYDTGLKRTLADVLYKTKFQGRYLFEDEPSKMRKKYCSTLAVALRLVWLRAKGKFVSDAPHFPHYEACQFLLENMGIEKSVINIHELANNYGTGSLTQYLSFGYAAGMHYMMNNTEIPMYANLGDWFFRKLITDDQDPTIAVLRKSLNSTDAGSGAARDRIITALMLAAEIMTNAWESPVSEYEEKVKNGEFKPITYSEWKSMLEDSANQRIGMPGIDQKADKIYKEKMNVIDEIMADMLDATRLSKEKAEEESDLSPEDIF